jgi:hypothetical protein
VGGIVFYNLKSEEKRNQKNDSTILLSEDDDDDEEEASKYALVSSSSENEDFVSPFTEKEIGDGEITELETFKRKESTGGEENHYSHTHTNAI